METPIESEPVLAAQTGDKHALDLLLEKHLPLVYNVVGRAMNGHPDVDDVVQETMLRAAQRIGSLRDPDRFRSWLLAIAVNQVKERARVRTRRTARESSLDQLGDRADPSLDFVDATVLELGLSGERREIAEATRLLSEEDQHLLALWWQELAGALSRSDLADALGVTPQHAAVRVQRMKARLHTARLVHRALRSGHRCRTLQSMLRGHHDVPGPEQLNRLSRHTRHCPRCEATGRLLVSPENLLRGIALVPIPATLFHRLPELLSGAAAAGHGGSAAASAGAKAVTAKSLLAKPVLAGGAAMAGAAAALSFAVYYLPAAPDSPPTPAPAPSPSVSATPSFATGSSPTRTSARAGRPGVVDADWYVAPDGNDAAPGTLGRPFASLNKAISVVRPGQTIALRGGRYRPTMPVVIETDGTAARRIVLSNYRGERPVLDAARVSASSPFVTHRGRYWTVQGIEVANSPAAPYVCRGCRHVTFRRLSMHDNQGSGLAFVDDGTDRNQVLDSDFFDNHDDANHGADADGLLMAFGSGEGNVIRRCRFFRNSDDGLGIASFVGAVTVDSSWSFDNGVNRWKLTEYGGSGNGFVLNSGKRPSDHVITNSAAWDNAGDGYTGATNNGMITLEGNTAFRNRHNGFDLPGFAATLRSNLAVGNGKRQAALAEGSVERGNSWYTSGWSVASLLSTDPSTAEGPRPPDGELPVTPFLAVRGGSTVGASLR